MKIVRDVVKLFCFTRYLDECEVVSDVNHATFTKWFVLLSSAFGRR